MNTTYDKYYQTKNLFGEPFPELIEYFSKYHKKGKVLDLGCGQGRDSIPLARLGYDVTGIDNSELGIKQMIQISKAENLKLKGIVADIFIIDEFIDYDFILLDSMFHFAKKDLEKETAFIKRIISKIKKGCFIIFCIQDTGKKIKILNKSIDFVEELHRLMDAKIKFVFKEGEHKSVTAYRIIIIQK